MKLSRIERMKALSGEVTDEFKTVENEYTFQVFRTWWDHLKYDIREGRALAWLPRWLKRRILIVNYQPVTKKRNDRVPVRVTRMCPHADKRFDYDELYHHVQFLKPSDSEHELRVKWQGVAYSVCQELDALLDRHASRGTGTLATAESIISAIRDLRSGSQPSVAGRQCCELECAWRSELSSAPRGWAAYLVSPYRRAFPSGGREHAESERLRSEVDYKSYRLAKSRHGLQQRFICGSYVRRSRMAGAGAVSRGWYMHP